MNKVDNRSQYYQLTCCKLCWRPVLTISSSLMLISQTLLKLSTVFDHQLHRHHHHHYSKHCPVFSSLCYHSSYQSLSCPPPYRPSCLCRLYLHPCDRLSDLHRTNSQVMHHNQHFIYCPTFLLFDFAAT